MRSVKPLIFTVLLLACLSSGTVIAQQQLSRISIAERSDDAGYVMRFHLTEMADSFTVAHSKPDLVQLNLYGDNFSDNDMVLIDNTDQIAEIQLSSIPGGTGVDISISEGMYFLTNAYPDVNGTDLLLSLEYATETEVQRDVNQQSRLQRPGDDEMQAEVRDIEPDDVETRDDSDGEKADEKVVSTTGNGLLVSFGLQGGVSLADVQGDGFSSDFRKGLTYGVAISGTLPYVLPYSIRTGIETGIFYTQKGFENPTQDYLSAQTVEFDYFEIPILGKLSYPFHKRFSPYVLIGPSLAFMVNAERIRVSDERRYDLDDRTNTMEVAGVFGGGIDTKVGEQVVNIQLKGVYSFKNVFSSTEESSAADAFKHRYISLEFGIRF